MEPKRKNRLMKKDQVEKETRGSRERVQVQVRLRGHALRQAGYDTSIIVYYDIP